VESPVTITTDVAGQRSGGVRHRKATISEGRGRVRVEREVGPERTWLETGSRVVMGLAFVFLLLVLARLFDRIKV
jgi:hypothetical protein